MTKPNAISRAWWLALAAAATTHFAGCGQPPADPAASPAPPAAAAPTPAAEPISTQTFEDGQLPPSAAAAEDGVEEAAEPVAASPNRGG